MLFLCSKLLDGIGFTKKNFFDFLSRFLVSDDIDKSFLRPQALTAVDFSLVIFRAK